MSNTILIGAQWGDEGKGKAVDVLSGDAEVVVRYQGGSNAGHTIEVDGKRYVLHLLPSGVVRADEGVFSVIGHGVTGSPRSLKKEIEEAIRQGLRITPETLAISDRAIMTLPYHKVLDGVSGGAIGTTNTGIGPSYADKADRTRCVRFGELRDLKTLEGKVRAGLDFYNYVLAYPGWKVQGQRLNWDDVWGEIAETRDFILPFVREDTPELIKKHDGHLLYEGAQGTLLDVDAGTSPFTTSSNTTTGGASTGSGVHIKFDRIIGITKAYTTRVGRGPFPTEFVSEDDVMKTFPSKDQLRAMGVSVEQWETARFNRAAALALASAGDPMALSQYFRVVGREFGASTGRPRRGGWGDAVIGAYAQMVNGLNEVCLTKMDLLDELPVINVAVAYEMNGQKINHFPSQRLAECKPIYAELPGWQKSIVGLTDYHQLPKNAKKYVEFWEERMGAPVTIIGTGPGREQTIIRK